MRQNAAIKIPRLAQANTERAEKVSRMALEQTHRIDKPIDSSRTNLPPLRSSAQNKPVSKDDFAKLASRGELYLAIGLLIFMAVLFFAGRTFYDDRYYTPEEGLGYWLGLSGGVMMLLALMYTAFKYVDKLRSLAAMKRWLTLHIFLGIIGPVLILVHSTFHIHSLNGGIALVSMLLVFVSGIVGRFFYSKTHYGLGGNKAHAQDLQEMLKVAGHKIKSNRLDRFAASVLTHKPRLVHALWGLLSFGWRSMWIYFRVNEDMRIQLLVLAVRKDWDRTTLHKKRREFKSQLRNYIDTLRKVAMYRVYERFTMFLRNAHVALIYLLLISGVVHVLAVHMY